VCWLGQQAIEELAVGLYDLPFSRLAPEQQDAVLLEVEPPDETHSRGLPKPRVHFYVSDTLVFPRALSVNPALTQMALSLRVRDRFLGRGPKVEPRTPKTKG
jgi:hypothetical protein